MKIDAHYYAVLGFCRACGFNRESACTIAYASQFVDDAKINHVVIEGDIPEGVKYDTIASTRCSMPSWQRKWIREGSETGKRSSSIRVFWTRMITMPLNITNTDGWMTLLPILTGTLISERWRAQSCAVTSLNPTGINTTWQ